MIDPCTYVPWRELNARPNIMIDGGAKDGTVLTLSHWPKSGTPESLKADSSTDIVFRYLETPAEQVPIDVVTGDHFDEDATLGLFAMCDPEFAVEHKDIICDAAMAGDFSTFSDHRAARIAFAIQGFANPQLTPFDKTIFELDYDSMCAVLFRELLPRVKPIVEHTEAFEAFWRPEYDFLTRSEAALAAGDIGLEEHPEVSLCVVRASQDLRTDADRARQLRGDLPYHPAAICNATGCDRVLAIFGSRYVFSYRYESWVQYISRRPPQRIDLHPFAEALSKNEADGNAWSFDGVEQIFPQMRLKGPEGDDADSRIPPDDMVARVIDTLSDGEGAWDPYDRPGEAGALAPSPH